jgi:hypothetical protein
VVEHLAAGVAHPALPPVEPAQRPRVAGVALGDSDATNHVAKSTGAVGRRIGWSSTMLSRVKEFLTSGYQSADDG